MLINYIKDLSKNSIYYGLGSAVRRFFAIFTAPIMTRIFEPADYGVISLVSTTIAFAGMVITLGISAGIFRHYYEVNVHDRKELLFSGIISQTIIIGSIILILAPFSGKVSLLIFGTDDYGYIFNLALIQLFIVELFEHFMTLLRYQKRPHYFLIVSSVQLSLNLLFLLFYVVYLRMGIPGVYYGIISAYVFPLLFLIFSLRKNYSLRMNISYVKDCIMFSVPLIPGWFVNMYLARSNKFFLQSFHSIDDVGLFSIGERIGGLVAMIMTVFFMAWNPVSMELINKKDQHHIYDSISRIFIFISATAIIGITFFAKEILIILTTEKYYPAYQYAGLIAFGTMTFYLNYFLGQGIIISKKTIYQSIARLVGAMVATGVFLLLIPYYQGLGAAFGSIIGYATASIVMIIISNKLYHLPYELKRLTAVYLSTLFVILSYLKLANDSFTISATFVLIKLLLLLFATVILALFAFKKSEIFKIISTLKLNKNSKMR
jgi:O-antigen/teichoic acid export membrane protein